MKRKGLARLLGLALALMLPMSAMAQGAAMDLLEQAKADGKEIVTTITFEPGATLAANQAVADMSAATSIRLNKLSGGYGAFALVLQGIDTVTAQLRVQSDGLYVQSEVLGAKPVYVSWEDVQKGITESMRANGASEASISQFTQGFINGFQQGLTGGMAGMMPATEGKDLSDEEIKQKIIEAMGGDDSFVKWMEGIQAKAVVTPGTYAIENADPADTKTEITLTKEDMASLYDTAYVQKQIAEQLKAQDSTLTDEQITAKTAETVASIKTALIASDMVMPMAFYSKGEDDMVAMEIGLTGNFDKAQMDKATDAVPDALASQTTADTATEAPAATAVPQIVKLDFHMTAARLTVEGGKQYTLALNGTEDDKPLVRVAGNFSYNATLANGSLTVVKGKEIPVVDLAMYADYTDAKHVTGELAATMYNENAPQSFVVGVEQTTGDTTVDTTVSLSQGATVDAIKADAATALIGSIKVNTVVQADSGMFSSLKEATPETAVQVMKLSAEELQSFMATLQSNGMQALMKIMGNLPQSVSTMVGGMMSGT